MPKLIQAATNRVVEYQEFTGSAKLPFMGGIFGGTASLRGRIQNRREVLPELTNCLIQFDEGEEVPHPNFSRPRPGEPFNMGKRDLIFDIEGKKVCYRGVFVVSSKAPGRIYECSVDYIDFPPGAE